MTSLKIQFNKIIMGIISLMNKKLIKRKILMKKSINLMKKISLHSYWACLSYQLNLFTKVIEKTTQMC